MRRVVVTGMGIACPLGVGVAPVWKRLIEGESGINAIQSFDTSDLPTKIAGQVPPGTRETGGLDVGEWVSVKDQKKMDPLHPSWPGRRHRGCGGFGMVSTDRGRPAAPPAS